MCLLPETVGASLAGSFYGWTFSEVTTSFRLAQFYCFLLHKSQKSFAVAGQSVSRNSALDSQLVWIICDDCCTECSKADSFRKSFAVACPNENERHDAQVVSLRTLSYVWGSCRNALFAAFRSPTQRTTPRPKTFRG